MHVGMAFLRMTPLIANLSVFALGSSVHGPSQRLRSRKFDNEYAKWAAATVLKGLSKHSLPS